MKKWSIIAALLLLAPLTLTAQPDDKGPTKADEEKIERLKIAFITTELNLTVAESEKFWPVYNEMDGKIKELKKTNRSICKETGTNFDNMTNEEARKKLNTVLDNDAKEAAIRKEYSDKISKVIGDKRALKLLSLEHEFRRELLERLREENSGQRPPGPPPHPQHDRE